MNKKVSTLLTVAITLGGSLLSSTAFAGDVTPKTFRSALLKSGENAIVLDVSKLGLPEGDTEIALTGNVDLSDLITTDKYQEGSESTRNYATPLVIVKDPVTITSAGDKKTFIGRIVAATDGITIKNLIMKTSEASVTGVGPWFSSLISVFADKVEISGNKFEGLERTGGFNEAIVIYPQSNDVNYKIEGNEFLNFTTTRSDSRANGAIKINREGKALNSYGYQGYESFKKIYDAIKSLNKKGISDGKDDNKGEYSASPSIDVNALVSENTFGDVNDSNILLFDGEEVSYAVFDDIKDESEGTFAVITSKASDNAVIVLKNTTLTEAQEYLSNHKADLAGKNLTYVLEKEKVNLPVGEVEELGNGYQNATLGGYISTEWGDYTPSTGTTNKVVLIYDGQAVKATKDAQGNVTYSLGTYDKNSYSEDNTASQYFFTLTPYELSAGKYELRLKDNYGNYFKVKDQYVTVKNVQVKVEEGKELYSSDEKQTWVEYNGENVVFPSELVLTAGGNNKYVKYDENTGFGVQNNYYLTQAFGISDIQIANVYASTLIDRYGDHFTLKITYKDDYKNDIDVTGVFAGNLRPCEVSYSNNKATYNYNLGTATDYMLVDANGNIIAIDLEKPLLAGKSEYGYTLTTISPKDYSLKPSKYAVWFRMEYTPGKDVDEVTAITDIKLGKIKGSSEYTLGLQKNSEGKIVLVAAGENYLLDEYTISVKLNEGSVVTPSAWLNKIAYYTVKSINKKTNSVSYGRFAGKVLGLNEIGTRVAFVDEENVVLGQPEAQFAIEYVDNDKDQWNNPIPAYFKFTNREKNKAATYRLDADKLYQIDATTFAYVNGETTPDTLSINPITTFSSEDGFKRFSPAELNANTYKVSMMLLNGDSLNTIEKHNDKHRLGLDEDNATEWRIEMPTVKLLDNTRDFLRYAADTVSNVTTIKFYADGDWQETQIRNPKEKYYSAGTELQICTYVLKNTDTNEYLNGKDYDESTGNAYYVCNEDEKTATRIAFKLNEEGTVNLVPVYEYGVEGWDWIRDKRPMNEELYESYAQTLDLSGNKIQGGASGDVLKDTELYEATANDLFVINVAEAPTYKKMEQGDKIILSLKNNTENVLVEGPVGGFATISNREAHKDLNPTLYVDTAYVNRAGNYAYQYLLGVRINRVDTTYKCTEPSHGTHRADTTFGYFLVNMIDSAKACTDVHNNKFVYNEDYKLDFVKGYHTNDTLFFTNDADEVISSMKIGDASYNMAKFAFKMIDEEANEFVIETGKGYDKQTVKKGSTWATVTNEVTTPSYLRWVNGNLVVTDNIDDAAHFTMETSDKEATANEAISAGNVVVAGTNGAVVVKGAEGKNVIVSTILGKVVANEVVSSDNAQITAPAGIVVVSVDGESFKVVVK